MKKVFVETYGCQMNEYDSELIRSILTKAGYGFVTDEQAADVVLLNTCAIREKAHRKVYGRIHKLRHDRNGRPIMIGILGCMATNLRTDLLDDKHLHIDFIAGPDSYKRLPELIKEAGSSGQQAFDVTLSEFETYSDILPARQKGVNAWIAVMRGCNNFCTFCVVPYTRGRERSRSPENVVEEARHLTAQGFKQVTLLGQNVNSYRHEDADFAQLIEDVSRVEGIERIRFTSPHPKDFPDRLLDVIQYNPKVCQHIHLPLQAGNNRILDLMNRTYTNEEFLALIDKIRIRMPNISLSTDIIVGFSSETDAEFEDTFNVMRQIEFDAAFIFKYSERQGTIAMKKHPDNVNEADKTNRIMRLNELQQAIMLKRNQAHLNSIMPVMIEIDAATHNAGVTQARTDGNTIVHLPVDVTATPGTLVNAKITAATPHLLRGECVSS